MTYADDLQMRWNFPPLHIKEGAARYNYQPRYCCALEFARKACSAQTIMLRQRRNNKMCSFDVRMCQETSTYAALRHRAVKDSKLTTR